jgi:hypothetical protein
MDTLVPAPGAASTCARPPTSITRSVIPIRPNPTRQARTVSAALRRGASTLVPEQARFVRGTVSITSPTRRSEIGIRLALGSTRAKIVGLVLRDNLLLMGAGLARGLPLAVAAMRGSSALLFRLTPTDVPTLLGATALLVSAGVLAAALPAWRASRIRPDVTLRCD